MNELNYKYPRRFTFNLNRNTKTGEQYVSAQPTTNQKVTLKNIKYVDVEHFTLSPDMQVSLLDVIDIQNVNQLKEHLDKLEKLWGIKKEPLSLSTTLQSEIQEVRKLQESAKRKQCSGIMISTHSLSCLLSAYEQLLEAYINVSSLSTEGSH